MSLVDYRAIFQLPQKEWWVLLSLDNQWGYEKENRFVAFTSPPACIPLLPLLELSYSESVTSIQHGLDQAGVNPNLLSTFPFNHILYLALNWEREYWAALAVKWLEDGYPISEEFLDRLKMWQKEKKLSQALRHRAGRLIKQYEHSQNIS
jgi:hypothetical protein